MDRINASRKQDSVFYIFLFFLFSNQMLHLFTECKATTYVLFLLLLTFYCFGQLDKNASFLLILILPDKYAQLIGILCWVLIQKRLYSPQKRQLYMLFIVYAFFVGIFNVLFSGGNLVNLIVQLGIYITYLEALDICIYYHWGKRDLSRLNSIFWVQILIVMVQMLCQKQMGDALTGSLISAHYLGSFFCGYLFLYIKTAKSIKVRLSNVVFTAGVCAITIYLLDAKHIVALFVFALIINWIYTKFHIRYKIICSVLLYTVVIGIFVFIAQYGSVKSYVMQNTKTVQTYVYNEKYNKKYTTLLNTMRELVTPNGILGFGVGQFGSQTALSSGKGIMYPWTDSSNKVMARPYRDAIDGVMTEMYVNHSISVSSMVLGYPLVSFIPLIAELGIIGLVIYLALLETLFSDVANKSLILMAFFMMVFDTYFEIPCVFVTLLFFQQLSERSFGTDVKKNKQYGYYQITSYRKG